MEFNAVTIESLLGAHDVALTTDKRAYVVTLATGERVTLASDDDVRMMAGLVSAHADKQAKARAESLLSSVKGERDTGPARNLGSRGNRLQRARGNKAGVTGSGRVEYGRQALTGNGPGIPAKARTRGNGMRNAQRAPGGLSGDVTVTDARGNVRTVDGPASLAARRQAARTRPVSAGSDAPMGTPGEIAREDSERAARMARATKRAR